MDFLKDFINEYEPSCMYEPDRISCKSACFFEEDERVCLNALVEILMLSYGCLCSGDLQCLLNLPADSVKKALSRLAGEQLVVKADCEGDRYPLRGIYLITTKGLKLLSERYSDKIPYPYPMHKVSSRNHSHARMLSLSLMAISSYCYGNGLPSRFETELQAGRYSRADAVFFTPIRTLYIEQDMHTERKGVLLQKFYDYREKGLSSVFTPEHAATDCLLFSFHKPGHGSSPNIYTLLDAELLYHVLVRKVWEEYGLSGDDILFEDVRAYTCRTGENRRSYLDDRFLAELSENLCAEHIPYSTARYGSSCLATARKKILSLRDSMRELTLYIQQCFGLYQNTEVPVFTFHLLKQCLDKLSQVPEGALMAGVSGYQQEKRTRSRFHDFAEYFCMTLIGSGRRDFLYPVFSGYSIFCISTLKLSSALDLVFWNRQSATVKNLEDRLLGLYHRKEPLSVPGIRENALRTALSYKVLSPELSVGVLPLYGSSHDACCVELPMRLRNCYYIREGIITCVEDCHHDAGAVLRAYMAYSAYLDEQVLHLFLYVDSYDQAVTLCSRFFDKPYTVSGLALNRPLLFLDELPGENFSLLEQSCIFFLQSSPVPDGLPEVYMVQKTSSGEHEGLRKLKIDRL